MTRSGYIAQIRAKIDRDPLLVVAASAIIPDASGRVLLQHRADTLDWAPPGGLMDLGESVRELLRREVHEETGLTIDGSPSLFGVYSGADYRMTYPNGDEIFAVICVFVCPDWEGVPTPDAESLALRWFSGDALPTVHPHHAPYLDDWFNGAGRVL